jgi:uncharacterized protein YggU (UPF0235/DUF167 family)
VAAEGIGSLPPVENAANRALVEFIAERLGIAKRCVRVV